MYICNKGSTNNKDIPELCAISNSSESYNPMQDSKFCSAIYAEVLENPTDTKIDDLDNNFARLSKLSMIQTNNYVRLMTQLNEMLSVC